MHFHNELEKAGFPKKWDFDGMLLIKTYSFKNMFTENLHRPSGPYEQLVWDVSPSTYQNIKCLKKAHFLEECLKL